MTKGFTKTLSLAVAVLLVGSMATACGTRSSAEEPEHIGNGSQLETAESSVVPQQQGQEPAQAEPEEQPTPDAIVVEGELEETVQPDEPEGEAAAQGEAVDLGLFPTGDKFMKPQPIDGIDINGKVVALTMDDGPSKYTPEVLDILKELDAKATFFVIGQNIAGKEDILKREYEEGHEIACHSWNHDSFTKISFDALMNDQIAKTNDAVEAATGKRTIMDRPPGGAINEELAAKIQRPQILWSADSEDWKFNRDMEKDAAVEAATQKTISEVSDGGMILLHDLHKTAPGIVRNLVTQLKADGYQFVTVSQLMQISKLRGDDVGFLFSRSSKVGAEQPEEEPSQPQEYDPEAAQVVD